MKICVQGLWHLGSVTAACLASVGHDVTGLDANAATIEKLAQGQAPLFEPGLDDLLQTGIANGKLRFSTSPVQALEGAEVLWVAFDTPVDDEDQADVAFVQGQIQMALPFLADDAVVLVSSQMPVGSIRKLEAFAQRNLPEKNWALRVHQKTCVWARRSMFSSNLTALWSVCAISAYANCSKSCSPLLLTRWNGCRWNPPK